MFRFAIMNSLWIVLLAELTSILSLAYCDRYTGLEGGGQREKDLQFQNILKN